MGLVELVLVGEPVAVSFHYEWRDLIVSIGVDQELSVLVVGGISSS